MKDERNTGVTSGVNKLGWEAAEFPILCETCLGDNPYIKMTKQQFGSECRICTRPFTIFRWKAGTKGRFKRTEICQTCAKLKNVCQTCIFDLQFGLPVEVRDKFLAENKISIPTEIPNLNYWSNAMNKNIENLDLPYDNIEKNPLLQQFQRLEPYYDRNKPKMCSFWKKGECTRGDICPYAHEQIHDDTGPMSKQNIKDRFRGMNDPVAEKIMQKILDKTNQDQKPPEDLTVKSIQLRNLSIQTTQKDIEGIYEKYGKIISVKFLKKQNMAYVNYETRQAAELALEQTYGRLILKDNKISVSWTKPYVPPKVNLQNQQLVLPSSIPRPKEEPTEMQQEQSKTNEILKNLLNPSKKLVFYSDDEEVNAQ